MQTVLVNTGAEAIPFHLGLNGSSDQMLVDGQGEVAGSDLKKGKDRWNMSVQQKNEIHVMQM